MQHKPRVLLPSPVNTKPKRIWYLWVKGKLQRVYSLFRKGLHLWKVWRWWIPLVLSPMWPCVASEPHQGQWRPLQREQREALKLIDCARGAGGKNAVYDFILLGSLKIPLHCHEISLHSFTARSLATSKYVENKALISKYISLTHIHHRHI